MDSYFEDGSPALVVSEDIDLFFNTAFALEASMKIIGTNNLVFLNFLAFGFILDENSYLTETWS